MFVCRILVGVLLAAVLAGSAAAQDYYRDIRPVLVQRCASCHSEQGPGWSMEDPETTYQLRHAIAAAVQERRMPPWLAEEGHQEYVGSLALPEAVREMVRRWRDDGFARGEPQPVAPVASHAAHGIRADASVDVLPEDGYLPDQSRSDDYRCFVLDWPGEHPAYVTGFRALPGNHAVAHHLVVHAVVPDMVERFRELEREEEGPGYQCFGGAIPDRLGQRSVREAYEARYPNGIRELARGNFWLAHWAPGMDGHQFPAGTGIRVEPGAGLVVQMHYYGGAAPGQRDADTRMEFELAERVERPAFHYPQTESRWLISARNQSMVIPPGGQATYAVADTLGNLLGYVARVTGIARERIAGLEVHSANLHMHAIGHSGVITLAHPRGTETLLAVPRWDIRWQRDFTFTSPKVFAREELGNVVLAVQCTFENPHAEPVYGGYGSDEEMCFNFSYIAVRLGGGDP